MFPDALPDLLHVSRENVLALAIPPARMRSAIAEVFADLASGTCLFLPKSQLDIGPGHTFQCMTAASHRWSKASIKWVGVGPAATKAALPAVSATICLNDLATGHPLALMDGEAITLLRTAAISAHAAEQLVTAQPETLGFAGCGAQAAAHLDAFLDLFPRLSRVLCHSRSAASAEALAMRARAKGYAAEVITSPDALVERSDILISSVPAAPGLAPILDAARLRPDALAIMVDLGRSWHPETLASFSRIATDSLDQMQHPLNAEGAAVQTVAITADLLTDLPAQGGRQAFCFRGHAAADLAAAVLVHAIMRETGGGRALPR